MRKSTFNTAYVRRLSGLAGFFRLASMAEDISQPHTRVPDSPCIHKISSLLPRGNLIRSHKMIKSDQVFLPSCDTQPTSTRGTTNTSPGIPPEAHRKHTEALPQPVTDCRPTASQPNHHSVWSFENI